MKFPSICKLAVISTLPWLLAPNWGVAQMATQPLLTRSTAVEPNLVFMFDDSASMQDDYVYQYGGSSGVNGMTGPGGTESALSPDVNRIYYNPRVTYKLRVDASGNDIATSTLSNSTTFNVYFYKKTASSTSSSIWDNTGNAANTGTSYFKTGTPAGYQPLASELKAGASTSTRYPNLASSSITSYPKWLGRTDCVANSTTCTWAEELRNYSIWKAYHSTRDKLAKTGIGLAFKTIGPTLRIGWGKINTLDGGSLDAGVSLFTPTVKSNFYTWLYGINSNVAGTPNRMALDTVGKYYSRTDSDGPWGSTPNAASKGSSTVASPVSTQASSSHLSCRRSFAMLMTDGYYNDVPGPGCTTTNQYNAGTTCYNSAVSVGNVDGADGPSISKPDGSNYKYKYSAPGQLYDDTFLNTMADVAMKYWVNDLRTLANNVPATNNNESFWQNMSFYAIGLGVFGERAQTQATIDGLKSGSISWPTPTSNHPRAIDDLWHATLNARGAMLTATDSQSLNDSVDAMMSSINQLTTTQSGVAVSTASLQTDTRKYTPQYTTGIWTGNVTAKNLDPNTGYETTTAWQVLGQDELSRTYNGIPAHGSRNILVGNAATSGTKAVPFTLASLTSSGLLGDMTAAARTATMVDYLRGDQSNEGDTGIYRTRTYVLGDIVNSSPVFIKGKPGRELSDPSNANSPFVLEIASPSNPLPGSGSVYTSYLQTLYNRSEGAVFVGANDGMLHVFRDGTNSIQGGQEILAYMPRTMLPKVHLLADKLYSHQYYVDGPNIETDAYWSGSWKQLIVGSTGAGAKTVYALNVTDPINLNSGSVLWEINPSIAAYANLGYVLADVQTGPTNGKDDDTPTSNDSVWAAYVGNGYESASGIASLFVIDLQTGARIREIQTSTSTGQGGPWSATVAGVTTNYKNGLTGVRLVLDDKSQRVVGAYAGDLRGNVWRFDLSDSDPNSWSASILFSTGNVTPSASVPTGYPKPITAIAQTVPHPTSGRVVVFGTGKFFEDKDVPAPYSTQSLYGIWDKTNFGTTFPPTGYPVASGTLVQRVFTGGDITQPDGTDPTVIDWTTKYGWYVDLANTGERLIYPVGKTGSRKSRVLKFDTLSPANVSVDACVQTGTGVQWKFSLDGLHGANPGKSPDLPSSEWKPTRDTNGDGSITSSDGYGLVTQGGATGRSTTMQVTSQSDSTKQTFVTVAGGDATAKKETFDCKILGTCSSGGGGGTPKTIKNREWRQLFLR